MLTFTVPGRPVPWQRAGYNRKTRTFFPPPKTDAYKQRVRWAAVMALHRAGHRRDAWKPLETPVRITLEVFFPDRRRRDLDNVQKAIGDALQGVLFVDDSQVVEWRTRKSVDRENPRCEVTVEVVS